MPRATTRPSTRPSPPGPRAALLAAGLLAAAPLAPAGRAGAQPAVVTPSLCDGTSGNLVQNCGFEVGTPSGWSVSAPPGSSLEIADLPTSSHTGRHLLRFSGFTTSSVMATLTTVPGARYTFTFYLVSLGIGAEPASSSSFQAYFDGRRVFDLVGQGPLFDDGYARYSFVEAATGARTEIRFDARNASAAYNLDDVSVVAAADVVPEPATVALVGGGLFALGALTLGRRRG